MHDVRGRTHYGGFKTGGSVTKLQQKRPNQYEWETYSLLHGLQKQ